MAVAIASLQENLEKVHLNDSKNEGGATPFDVIGAVQPDIQELIASVQKTTPKEIMLTTCILLKKVWLGRVPCALSLCGPACKLLQNGKNESASNVNLAAGDVSTLLLHMLPNPGSFLKRLPAIGFPALRCLEGFHFKEGTLYRTLYWGEIHDYKVWCDKMATERCI